MDSEDWLDVDDASRDTESFAILRKKLCLKPMNTSSVSVSPMVQIQPDLSHELVIEKYNGTIVGCTLNLEDLALSSSSLFSNSLEIGETRGNATTAAADAMKVSRMRERLLHAEGELVLCSQHSHKLQRALHEKEEECNKHQHISSSLESKVKSWRLENERALSQLQVANNKNKELTQNLRDAIAIREEKIVEFNSSNLELKAARLSLARDKAWRSVCVTLLQRIRECEAESVLEYALHTARHAKEEIKEARQEIHDLRGNLNLGETYLSLRKLRTRRYSDAGIKGQYEGCMCVCVCV
jgi:hypothetical protein